MKTLFSKKQILTAQIVLSTLIPLTSFYGCGGAAPIPGGGSPVPGVVDLDLDTVSDSSDNCPSVANTDQADLDGDSIGNICDDDADGDTVLATAGDCNDLDASVKPGAADLPDLNYTDNNCDGMDGNSAAAIWVAGDGNDVTGNGTIGLPYRTLQKGIDEAVLASKDVYAAAGSYPQGATTINMKGTRLYGGFGSLSGGVRPRDLNSNIVAITSTAGLGAVGFNTNDSGHDAVLQGVRIDAERGVIVINNKPTIEGNNINVPSNSSVVAYGIALYPLAPANAEAIVANNQIVMGTNSHATGANFGIVTINLHDGFTVKLNAHDNHMVIGEANKVVAGILGFGETSLAKTQMDISKNHIENRAAGTYSFGIALGLKYSAGTVMPAFFDRATVLNNTVLGDRVTSSGSMSLALALNNPASVATMIQNNVLQAGKASMSMGLMAYTTDLDIFNNTILTSQAGVSQRGIMVQGFDPANVADVAMDNNIIASLDVLNPTDVAIVAMGHVLVSEINNNLLDIDYPHYYQDGVVDLTNLTDVNALAFADNNIEDNPLFASVATSNFHLASSAAPGVDEGMNLAEVTTDIDGETRTAGSYDIGADEVH